MDTFDQLIQDILSAQDDLTHLNEMGAAFESDVRKAKEARSEAIERLRAWVDAYVASERKACASIEPPYNEDEGFESTYIDGYLQGWYGHCDAIRARGEHAIRNSNVSVDLDTQKEQDDGLATHSAHRR